MPLTATHSLTHSLTHFQRRSGEGKRTNKQTNGRTNEPTNEPTDGRTDRRTMPSLDNARHHSTRCLVRSARSVGRSWCTFVGLCLCVCVWRCVFCVRRLATALHVPATRSLTSALCHGGGIRQSFVGAVGTSRADTWVTCGCSPIGVRKQKMKPSRNS